MATSIVEVPYADQVYKIKPSPIREMLKDKYRISLGGGFPAPESFPIPLIASLHEQVQSEYGPALYQYDNTIGFKPLIDALPEFLARPNRQVTAKPENILVTAGSQSALSLIGRIFIDPGSKILVESPTYLGALQAFDAYGPNYLEAPMDREGLIPGQLEEIFRAHPDLKFLYTIPTFQNPSGSCMTIERRKAVADLLRKYGKIAVEDDPYSELRYEGEDLPSLQSMAPENVIHLFTFSKTLAPGFRVGGMVAPKEIRDVAEKFKQGSDLFTSSENQAVVAAYLAGHHIEGQIQKNRELYRHRRDVMAQAIAQHFPASFVSNCPEGGMFLWSYLDSGLAVPDGFSMNRVLEEAKSEGVGFVTGAPFFARPESAYPSMRLNFTNQPDENIVEGIKIIGDVLKRRLS